MLEGITILNEEIVYTATGWSIFGGIVAILVGLIFLVVVVSAIIDGETICSMALGLVFVIGFGFVGITAIKNYVNRIEYIQYEATISKEVSLTEFYERYEVIEKGISIFTIREVKE